MRCCAHPDRPTLIRVFVCADYSAIMSVIRRIGILTGGGDCPGLNAVIRAVARDALLNGYEVAGVIDGFLGLIENRVRRLDHDNISNILHVGGTILGTSNKANPARFAVGANADGSPMFADVSERCVKTIAEHRIDALVVIGGDGTMICADHIARHGVPIVGVPKTIDNDLHGTDLTFGFLTAVSIATEAIDRVTTTAAAHHRVMVVEVMGRNAGWIAAHAGMAGGADVILIPEMPFSMDAVAKAVLDRRAIGRGYTIVCVAEGARPLDGGQVAWRHDPTSPDPIRLGGVGRVVAEALELSTKSEARWVVLGHTQRGGEPVAADRVLATLFGYQAMRVLKAGRFNRMVAIRGTLSAGGLTDVDISEAASGQRLIPTRDESGKEHGLIAAARAVGTRFGDEMPIQT